MWKLTTEIRLNISLSKNIFPSVKDVLNKMSKMTWAGDHLRVILIGNINKFGNVFVFIALQTSNRYINFFPKPHLKSDKCRNRTTAQHRHNNPTQNLLFLFSNHIKLCCLLSNKFGASLFYFHFISSPSAVGVHT